MPYNTSIRNGIKVRQAIMVGHFNGGVPIRTADYLDPTLEYSLDAVARNPGHVFTRNMHLSDNLPHKIVCRDKRFIVEFDDDRNAAFCLPIPSKYPQRYQMEGYDDVEANVSIEGGVRPCEVTTIFVFGDDLMKKNLHIRTTDVMAARMSMAELAFMSSSIRGLPFKYLAAYEGREYCEDFHLENVLTDRYFFHTILMPTPKDKCQCKTHKVMPTWCPSSTCWRINHTPYA